MALIKCPECGAEVSDNAANCPKCGRPMAAGRKGRKGGLLLGSLRIGWMSIVIIAVIVALFALLGTCNWKPVV